MACLLHLRSEHGITNDACGVLEVTTSFVQSNHGAHDASLRAIRQGADISKRLGSNVSKVRKERYHSHTMLFAQQ